PIARLGQDARYRADRVKAWDIVVAPGPSGPRLFAALRTDRRLLLVSDRAEIAPLEIHRRLDEGLQGTVPDARECDPHRFLVIDGRRIVRFDRHTGNATLLFNAEGGTVRDLRVWADDRGVEARLVFLEESAPGGQAGAGIQKLRLFRNPH